MGKITFTSSVCLLQFADEQQNTGTRQKYRLQKVSLTVNIKHGKAVAVLKQGLKRTREQDAPGHVSDALEHGIARFDSGTPWHPKTLHQQKRGVNLPVLTHTSPTATAAESSSMYPTAMFPLSQP